LGEKKGLVLQFYSVFGFFKNFFSVKMFEMVQDTQNNAIFAPQTYCIVLRGAKVTIF